MKHRRQAICFLGSIVVIISAFNSLSESGVNPYQAIVERNAFALKPLPPPQAETPPPAPPAPLAKVTLTGITSMFGPSSKRALLEIVEQEPGKAVTSRKPILREGERDGEIEVLSIDVEKNIVRIRNGTVDTNISFEVQKPSQSPAAPASAGVTKPNVNLAQNPAATPPGAAGPVIIGRESSSSTVGRGAGVTIVGGGANTAQAATTGAPLSASGASTFGSATASSFAAAGANSSLGFGSRPLRTETPRIDTQRPVTPEERHLHVEIMREMNRGNPKYPPWPGTPLNPGAE